MRWLFVNSYAIEAKDEPYQGSYLLIAHTFNRNYIQFTPGTTAVVDINDHENYTSFTLHVPSELEPGKYVFEIMLGPAGKGATGVFQITSGEAEFTVPKRETHVRISNVTPNIVKKDRLSATQFMVQGTGLDGLDTNRQPSIGSAPPVYLRYQQTTPTLAKLKVSAEPHEVSLGAFPIKFFTTNGEIVFSTTRIKLE